MRLSILSTTVKDASGGVNLEMELGQQSQPPDQGGDFVSFRVTLDSADQYPRLAELQKVALQRVRGLIDDEIQRLQLAQGRTP